jgi:hypothetical protein
MGQGVVRWASRVLGLVKTILLKTFINGLLWKRFQIIKMFIFIGVLHFLKLLRLILDDMIWIHDALPQH